MRGRAVIFTGPTLSAEEGRRALDAEFLPPAAQGDLYRAALGRPAAIGLVDGLFERVPSVWHKEVLWAVSRGVAVFGAASMGALRAAELEPFGMRGVGAVYAAYRGGAIEDDDEVAVVHGPAESGFRPLSVALVNIRATLAEAERQGAIGAEARARLERLAKARFYAERSYHQLLADAEAAGVPGLAALRAWLPGRQVDQKRADALEMLAAIRAHLEAGAPPPPARFHFEHTSQWERVVREEEARGHAAGAEAERERP